MAYQSQSQGYTAFKVQSALGTQASGSAGTVLRTTGGAGGKLVKAATESQEVRRDMMSSRGRHGTQKTSGSASGELSLGVADDIMQAVFRGTWGAANLAITEATASLTSITTTTSTIVASAGSWITAGLRVGDVIVLTGHATAANNSKNLRITGLTANTITVAETLVLDATPDTAFTITRTGRVLINPAAGSIVNRYFTIEEYEADIDASTVFTDCMWGSLKFTMSADGILMMDTSWVGTGQAEVLGAAAPLLTSPTEPTGTPLSVVDATIRFGSADQVALTGLELTFDTAPSTPSVFGSGAIQYSPDVFPGNMKISGSVSMLRADLSHVTSFLDETQLSLQILAVENESEPKSFVSIYLPNFTLGDVARSSLSKSGGAMTQTLAIPDALVGIDDRGGAYDSTMAKIQVSNAS